MMSKLVSLALAFSSVQFSAAKPEYCADVLMYDTYGDGWGLDTLLHVNNDTYSLVSDWENGLPISNTTQCSSRVHRFCSDDGDFTFFVSDTSAVPTKPWEVFFAIEYFKKTIYGTVGSRVKLDRHKMEFEDVYDASNIPENKCDVCPHNAANQSIEIDLSDSRGKSWYANAGPVVDIEGFKVPAVLVYPKYYITRLGAAAPVVEPNICDTCNCASCIQCCGRKLVGNAAVDNGNIVTEASLCAPKGSEVCVEGLEDGHYKFFVAGRAQGDESWSFCNSTGGVGEQLEFDIENGVCHPISQRSGKSICSTEPEEAAPNSEDILETLVVSETLAQAGYTTEVFEMIGAASLCVCALLLIASKFMKKEEVAFVELTQSSHNGKVAKLTTDWI